MAKCKLGWVIMYVNKDGDDFLWDKTIYSHDEAAERLHELERKANKDEKYWITESFCDR